MADALRMAQFHCLADVEGELPWGNQTRGQLACVQRDVDARIEAVAVADDLHAEVVFDQRAMPVFGAQVIDRDNSRVARGQRKPSIVCAKICAGVKSRSTPTIQRTWTLQPDCAWGVPQCSMELRWASISSTFFFACAIATSMVDCGISARAAAKLPEVMRSEFRL